MRRFTWAGLSRRSLLAGLAAAVLPAGCGTIIHPERTGQPRGRLDPGVVLLDGLGLLFFFIPGVIAFIVDFSTGAIYLPPDHASLYPPTTNLAPVSQTKPTPHESFARRSLRRLGLYKDPLTEERLEIILSEHLGRPIRLSAPDVHRERLSKLNPDWLEDPQDLAAS